MYLCYIDESGTSQVPGNTSHFVLAGLSIPIEYWKKCDRAVAKIKKSINLRMQKYIQVGSLESIKSKIKYQILNHYLISIEEMR